MKLRVSGVVLLLLLALNNATASSAPNSMYWVERIERDGTIVVHRYNSTTATRVRNIALEFPSAFEGIEDPFTTISFEDRDWSEEVLRKGLAKLRNPVSAAATLRRAEGEAKAARRGVWASLPAPRPPPAPAPATAAERWNSFWNRVLAFIALWGGIGTLIASVIALIAYLVRIARRTRVYMLFLGPQAVGKTWLWCRLVDPEITKKELLKMGVSPVRDRFSQRTREPFGKHELRPVYVTVPGGQPGTHFDELLESRWFVRTKSIWIVTLAPTRDTTVTKNDADARKIDASYVAEQLGYMAVPVGAISAARVPRPAMVLVVITKFDLFSDHDATHSASVSARETLERVFADHVARVKQACAQKKIPFGVEVCSALEGWRTDALLRHVKKSLFV